MPVALRRLDRIEAGTVFEFERLAAGQYRLVRHAATPNKGLLDWLLACPEKGFFIPIESESTDVFA